MLGEGTKKLSMVNIFSLDVYLSYRWPAYIYNPSRLNAKLRSKAIPVAGKKHTVLYFGSKDFGFVSPSQIKRPFEEFKEEFSKQTISKKYLAMFQQAIPDAEAELAKPKEDRMFIERPQHKRKLVPNSRKKSTKPTLKEVKTVEEEVEEKDEEEEEEDEEEEEEEDEVVSGDESEAEFDDSPRKKPKTLRKTNEQSHKQTDKSSSHKKPRKSSPTDVSKREVSRVSLIA